MALGPARAGAVYLLGNLLAAAVPFLLLPVLTRVLTPQDYGQVVAFMVLVTVTTAVAGLSAHGAIGVAWFRERREDLPAHVAAATLLVLASGALLALPVLAFWPAADGAGGLGPGLALLAVLTACCTALLQIRLVLWQSARRPWAHTLLQVLASGLNVGLSLLAVLVLQWGGVGRIGGIAGAALLVAGVALAWIRHERLLRWRPLGDLRAPLRGLLAFGLPLLPHASAGVAMAHADRALVAGVLGAEALGHYGAAAQLGAVMALLGDAFVKSFNPWLYQRLARGAPDDHLRVVAVVYGAVPAFVLLGLLAGAVLLGLGGWLLGPAYRPALALLPWFVAGGVFTGLYLSVSGLYFQAGRTGVLAGLTVLSACVGLLLTSVLVRSHGLHGAGAGYMLTQALLALLAQAVARRLFALPWRQPRAAFRAWRRDAAQGVAR